MYVCVCLAVTEAQVRSAIEAGASSRDVVTQHCRAGGDCGACHGMIDQMIEDHLEDKQDQLEGARPSVSGCPPPAADSGERLVEPARLVRGNRAA
jgi:bacterioferritin-associated ferredoxin